MNLLRWFKSKFETAPLNRVAAVTCDDKTINFQWPRGTAASSTWDDIERVLIRTTDQGPFDDDVFFFIETADKNFVISQTATGASQLLERLQQLPGFDNEAVIDSMGCTDNNEFLCWERVCPEFPRQCAAREVRDSVVYPLAVAKQHYILRKAHRR